MKFCLYSTHFLLSLQEYGSPSKFGHKVMKGKDPETQEQCDVVFIPSHKKGEWAAELSVSAGIANETVVDSDRDALLDGQVHQPQTNKTCHMSMIPFLLRTVTGWLGWLKTIMSYDNMIMMMQ